MDIQTESPEEKEIFERMEKAQEYKPCVDVKKDIESLLWFVDGLLDREFDRYSENNSLHTTVDDYIKSFYHGRLESIERLKTYIGMK